jgi:hypothetical protein
VKENGVGTEDFEIAKIAHSLMQVVAKTIEEEEEEE